MYFWNTPQVFVLLSGWASVYEELCTENNMERSVWARKLVSAAALLVKQRSLFWFETTEGEKDYLVSHSETCVGCCTSKHYTFYLRKKLYWLCVCYYNSWHFNGHYFWFTFNKQQWNVGKVAPDYLRSLYFSGYKKSSSCYLSWHLKLNNMIINSLNNVYIHSNYEDNFQ